MPRQRRSTAIRTERKATAARKRAAFEFQTPTKKPLACAKGYDFACDRSASERPGCYLSTLPETEHER